MPFDELLTSSARLSIIASLVPGDPLTFSQLKNKTGLADGNLHVQARRLQAAGYIRIEKDSREGRSLTWFQVTELGLESLKLHVRKLQAILTAEGGPVRPRVGAPKEDDSQVWH